VWTTWAIPALDFDIYLTGFDTRVLDIGAAFCGGDLPLTGSAVSLHGSLSGDPIDFSSCNNTAVPGSNPVWGDDVISVGFRSHLQAWFTCQIFVNGFPHATQRFIFSALASPGAAENGWIALDLDHGGTAPIYGSSRAQAWVIALGEAGGTLRTGWRAMTTDGVCSASNP